MHVGGGIRRGRWKEGTVERGVERRRRKEKEGSVTLATGELHKQNVTASYIVNSWQSLLLLH